MLNILIPTKDRPFLAIEAAKSVINQLDYGRRIFLSISDNSESSENAEIVKNFCFENSIDYLRPEVYLSMSNHWDWAMENIQKREYVFILTDRFILKNNIISSVLDYIRINNVDILSFANDNISVDFNYFYSLNQFNGSDEYYKLSSIYLSQLASDGILKISLPRGLNSIISYKVFDILKQKKGFYFQSIAPDFNLAFSILAEKFDITYFDSALIVSRGSKFSNGGSFSKGKPNSAAKSFISDNLKNGYSLTKVPYVFYSLNAILHEYEYVRITYPNNDLTKPNLWSWYGLILERMNRDPLMFSKQIKMILDMFDIPYDCKVTYWMRIKSFFTPKIRFLFFFIYFILGKVKLSEHMIFKKVKFKSNKYPTFESISPF
jgi:hypothetical protein